MANRPACMSCQAHEVQQTKTQMVEKREKSSGGGMTVREAGRRGGAKVAAERGSKFYSEIGRKGGEAVSQNREHMANIGRKGGERRGKASRESEPVPAEST